MSAPPPDAGLPPTHEAGRLSEHKLALATAAVGLVTAVLTGAFGVVQLTAKQDAQASASTLQQDLQTETREAEALQSQLDQANADNRKLQVDKQALARALDGGQLPGPGPTAAAAPARYQFEFADRTRFDFDAKRASLSGGAGFELYLRKPFLYFGEDQGTWADTTVVYIKSSDASRAGCEQGTDLKSGLADLKDLGQGESVCVGTSEGKWAVLTMEDQAGNNVVYDVQLFE
jgi:hypothetical protein